MGKPPKKKGDPKTGGRVAGIPNQGAVRRMFWEVCLHKNFDPLDEMIRCAEKIEDPEKKAKVCALFLPYLYPRKKEISFSYTEAKFGHTDLTKLSTVQIQSTIIELLTQRGFRVEPPKALPAAVAIPPIIKKEPEDDGSPF